MGNRLFNISPYNLHIAKYGILPAVSILLAHSFHIAVSPYAPRPAPRPSAQLDCIGSDCRAVPHRASSRRHAILPSHDSFSGGMSCNAGERPMQPGNTEFSRYFAISRLPYAPVSGILPYCKYYVLIIRSGNRRQGKWRTWRGLRPRAVQISNPAKSIGSYTGTVCRLSSISPVS